MDAPQGRPRADLLFWEEHAPGMLWSVGAAVLVPVPWTLPLGRPCALGVYVIASCDPAPNLSPRASIAHYGSDATIQHENL
jgi:hypothetical protein